MFETELSDKLKRIFDLTKVSYNQPSESQEQDCLFIQVEKADCKITQGKARARVSGNAFIFSLNDRLPFGYLAKKIQAADPDDTKDLFFFDIEENTKEYQNLVRRGFSFVYFYSGDYNPVSGTITEIDLDIEES